MPTDSSRSPGVRSDETTRPSPSGVAGDSLPATWSPRFYRPTDDPAIIDVLTSAFDGWPKVPVSVPPRDHLRWKLDIHPHARKLSLIAEVGGQVVGWQAYWLQPLVVEGKVLLSKQGVDFCVHPDYQQMSIRTRMRAVAQDNPRRNFQVHFGLQSGHPANKRLERRDGRPGRRFFANGVEALECGQGAGRPAPSVGDWTLRRVARFDDRIDKFWRDACKPFLLIVERKKKYLNWRYADPRGGTFLITIAELGDHVAGYVVTTASRGRGYIADLLALPGRTDVARSLLRHAVDELRRDGNTVIECWSPREHPYRSALQAHGFVHKRRSIAVSSRPAREYEQTLEMAFADDPMAPIHVALGDFDLV